MYTQTIRIGSFEYHCQYINTRIIKHNTFKLVASINNKQKDICLNKKDAYKIANVLTNYSPQNNYEVINIFNVYFKAHPVDFFNSFNVFLD